MSKTFSTITLLGLLTLSAAQAQSSQPIRAKVPFDFTVGKTTLAAGNYQLTYSSTAHIISIQGLDRNSRTTFVNAIPANPSTSSNGSGRLVFECLGGTCYMAQVWKDPASGDLGFEVRPAEQRKVLAFNTRVISVTIPAK